MAFPSSLPEPVVIAPDSVPSLGWGIIGPGGIANAFTQGVQAHTSQRIVAVASRDQERGRAFADKYGIARAYASYEQLVAAPEVDVVYIASQHHVHHEQALLAIRAGKHVLVEKPFTATAAQAREVAAAAAAAGVLVMEAMWTRYLPQSSIIRQLVADGVFGEIRLLTADHGQKLTHVARLIRPELAGGALLDLGVYPVAFASSVLGTPKAVRAEGFLHDTGVDAQTLLNLSYDGGVQAQLSTTLLTRTPTVAAISGSDALLEVSSAFYRPSGLRLVQPRTEEGALTWRDTSAVQSHFALSYQATALASYLAEGRLESPLHPLSEVVAIMETLESARHQVGYRMPGE